MFIRFVGVFSVHTVVHLLNLIALSFANINEMNKLVNLDEFVLLDVHILEMGGGGGGGALLMFQLEQVRGQATPDDESTD